MQFLAKLFGTSNDRVLKQYKKIVQQIGSLEVGMSALPDNLLQGKTALLRARLQKGETLDAILPEAFAVVREAAKRTLGMRHFDVQLQGGLAIHHGNIAQMATGEGKTLTSTLPIYMNALSGKGVHVVTVNEYLAERDALTMGKLFNFLGLSVGVNTATKSTAEKKDAYLADITYGTNNEFGFDYLRDNMVYDARDKVQRGLAFAIVDEVDSILIDEARSPLIITGQTDNDVSLFKKVNALPPLLTRQREGEDGGDYIVDEKNQQVLLTESGHDQVETLLHKLGLLPPGVTLYEPSHIALVHHVNVALRAHSFYKRDQQYVVMDNTIVVVDENTGRMLPGRRWADGLHQAIEAKEAVPILQDNQTLASITFQNYFRLYGKLSGMTGTADTEAYEFKAIYNLETIVIPTNTPNVRIDFADMVFRTTAEKYQHIAKDIEAAVAAGQPVLVGTTSVENSETLSNILTRQKIAHQVLNAKNHAKEADVIAQAGRPAKVTIATNMAGRGTDIVLGGNITARVEEIKQSLALSADAKIAKIAELTSAWENERARVIAAGGLHIIGSERHESRRIDNQLRGRAARQGDVGSSCFYASMEDPLLRIFGGEKMRMLLDKLNIPRGVPIQAGIVNRSIESAQRKVEGRNFEVRKELLEFDNIDNDQRNVIYDQRDDLLATNTGGIPVELRRRVLANVVAKFVGKDTDQEQWDISGLEAVLLSDWRMDFSPLAELIVQHDFDADGLTAYIVAAGDGLHAEKTAAVGEELFEHYERLVMLQGIDTHWRNHLLALDSLRDGIHLRGYAQKDPKQEYKREAFGLFEKMLDAATDDMVKTVLTTQTSSAQSILNAQETLSTAHIHNVRYQHQAFAHEQNADAFERTTQEPATKQQPFVNVLPKVGRNEPCPCGSGSKFKQCHGKTVAV